MTTVMPVTNYLAYFLVAILGDWIMLLGAAFLACCFVYALLVVTVYMLRP